MYKVFSRMSKFIKLNINYFSIKCIITFELNQEQCYLEYTFLHDQLKWKEMVSSLHYQIFELNYLAGLHSRK